MASIEEQLRNVRTLEDIVNLLSILFTNLNNQNEQYYDMFLNPVPMDLELERYDENGELVTVIHPNVAKMRITAYSGEGNPNGKVVASVGSLYIDLIEPNSLYYKATGVGATGWITLWAANNLVEGTNFLAPNGDGSQLTGLNASSITSGVLSTKRGGTGDSGTINGLVKGNGDNKAYAEAVDGEDYLGPNGFTGMISYFPFDITEVENSGWLVCDGSKYSVEENSEYGRLCKRIKDKYKIKAGSQGMYYAYKYGTDDIVYVTVENPSTSSVVYRETGVASLLAITSVGTSSITLSNGDTYEYYAEGNYDASEYADTDVDGITVFRVPNLIGRYIKGGVATNIGKVESGSVKAHTHELVGNTGGAGEHSHNKGTMNITGYICAGEQVFKDKKKNPPSSWGAFSQWKANVVSGSSPNDKFDNNIWKFNAANTGAWTGNTSVAANHTHSLVGVSTSAAGTETNEVDHIVMIPVIKY